MLFLQGFQLPNGGFLDLALGFRGDGFGLRRGEKTNQRVDDSCHGDEAQNVRQPPDDEREKPPDDEPAGDDQQNPQADLHERIVPKLSRLGYSERGFASAGGASKGG